MDGDKSFSPNQVPSIIGTNGFPVLSPVVTEGGLIVANLARRVGILFDDDSSLEKTVPYSDVLFLIKSLIFYVYSDAKMVSAMGSTTLFFEFEDIKRPQDRIIKDLSESLDQLKETLRLLGEMPVAKLPDDALASLKT